MATPGLGGVGRGGKHAGWRGVGNIEGSAAFMSIGSFDEVTARAVTGDCFEAGLEAAYVQTQLMQREVLLVDELGEGVEGALRGGGRVLGAH